MELWIRSQDKTDLFKINRLKIREHVFENGEKEYFILNNNSISDVVGVYKTKERALEVLDEIQKILEPIIFIKDGEYDFTYKDGGIYRMNVRGMKNNEIQELSIYVYEMPEE